MTPGAQEALDGIRRAFVDATIEVEEDGAGGAYVIVNPVVLGPKFTPDRAWFGAHLPPQLPYADVYPLFMGGAVVRTDGSAFVPPVTQGHNFRGRPAIQISRKTNRLDPQNQTAACKFLKVIHWLQTTT